MKKLTASATIVLLVAAAAPASAQTFGFGAHAGLSVPMGDYGSTEEPDGGFAEMGFSGGLDLVYPLIAVPGLSWYSSVDAIAHSIDDGAEGVEDGGYLYFPIMTGARFDVPVGMTKLFLTGQVGLIVSRPPNVDFGAGEVDADIGTSFGFALGGGLQFTDNIYAGLKFYPLGDIEMSWDDFSGDRSVSFLDLYVGFGVF
ncbi:MAG: hypothetical protein ACOCUW_03400 [Gemmatimonadota bacterium]